MKFHRQALIQTQDCSTLFHSAFHHLECGAVPCRAGVDGSNTHGGHLEMDGAGGSEEGGEMNGDQLAK